MQFNNCRYLILITKVLTQFFNSIFILLLISPADGKVIENNFAGLVHRRRTIKRGQNHLRTFD